MLTSKKITGIAFALVSVLFVLVSCNENNGGGVVIQLPEDTSALAKINHFIPSATIREYQAAFARERDSLQKLRPGLSIPSSEAFNKKALIELLQIPDCVGIRVLYGAKQNGNNSSMRLILVGVDSKGNNLYLKDQPKAATNEPAAKKQDSTAPQKMNQSLDGGSGGVEQGQCDPPCTY